ncbi:hypothetical protein TNCV_4247091 [Trichonephila clavipes]|nr:hypothetical protein TNCV_4247091 [Trichonephila clavipes]
MAKYAHDNHLRAIERHGREKLDLKLCIHHDERISIQGRRGECTLPFCIRYSHTGNVPDVMVWAVSEYMMQTSLVHVASNLNSQHYISQILRSVTVLYCQCLEDFTPQQDKAISHVARLVAIHSV